MKTSELTGAQLDYWVAKALGAEDATLEDWGDGEQICITAYNAFERVPFRPSSKWSDGGPIIEREKMGSSYDGRDWLAGWLETTSGIGQTLLVAAMRAYVTSKFGDEVPEIPG